jgi:8-hydroxy-5-deazaflavin:NADPH oxidoreductase
MKIVILGPGRIGSTLASFLAPAGHELMLSAFRDEPNAERLAEALGARLGSLDEARAFGQVFFLAVPHAVAAETVQALIGARGVLVDCTNQFGGSVPAGAKSTSEYLASLAPELMTAKAFNTLRYDDLRSRANFEVPIAIPFCSDSAAAGGIIETLIRQCGYAPLNLGPLANGVLQEPGGPFFLEVLEIDEAIRMANDIESTAGYTPSSPPE